MCINVPLKLTVMCTVNLSWEWKLPALKQVIQDAELVCMYTTSTVLGRISSPRFTVCNTDNNNCILKAHLINNTLLFHALLGKTVEF